MGQTEFFKNINAILDCVADVAKPASVIAIELNMPFQKAEAYCRLLERKELVIVTIGASHTNATQNVKYFKKA